MASPSATASARPSPTPSPSLSPDATDGGGGNGAVDDPCAADYSETYDMALHIWILFAIMLCSFAGTMLPVVGRRFKLLGKMFGAGVILATAWVHMFAPADQALTNPCLPPLFTADYTSWAGALALLAALSTHLIQFLASRAIRQQLGRASQSERKPSSSTAADRDASEAWIVSTVGAVHGHHLMLLKEKHVTTYMLELGIATHSIIIGLTLGVARGNEVRSLAVALVFHQFFEGLALSTVVLESDFGRNFVTFGMVLFYTLTTPFGIALGIGINAAYNTNAQNALLAQGILDALSAGILAYDALVNIIFMHFSAPALRLQSDFAQFLQLGSLWLGAFVMALLGRWA
ncbi:Zinc/iron permease [Zopfochytrium polystomum]|nr:Zinc/iron permease [Zopfochytrium polystomum]